MVMTVFEIPHEKTAPYNRLNYIVICNKYTIGKFTTTEYDYGFARFKFIFKHYKDKNEIDVQFTLLPNKKNENENVYVYCEETNYTKRHIIAATYNIGEVRYVASYGNELIFYINISVCKANEKKLAAKLDKDKDFHFIISASDDDSVIVHKLRILKDNTLVKEDLTTKGVTLKDLAKKICKDKKKTEIEINETDIFGNPVSWTAVLDYVDENRIPELAADILKTTPGFIIFSYVAVRDSSKSKTSEDLTDDNPPTEHYVVIHQNVQSLKDKIPLVNSLNRAHKPDVLALSEVFSRKAEIERIRLTGYVLAHCNCRTSVAHGGAAIYIRDGLQYTRRDDLQSIAEQVHFEITAIEVNHIELVAIALYRTGNGKFTKYLEKLDFLLDKLTDEGKKFLIVGDHNVHEITDDNFKRRQRRKVEYIINSYGCVNTVKFRTRGDASLDCGIANHARNDLVVTPVDANISDHTAQYYVFTTNNWSLKDNALESKENRLFNNGAIHLLYQDIINNINTITDDLDAGKYNINQSFDELLKMLMHYVDLHFPVDKRKTVPCLDEKIKQHILECNEFLEVKRDYPDDSLISDIVEELMFEKRQIMALKKLELCLSTFPLEQEIWRTNGVNEIELQEAAINYVDRNDEPFLSNNTEDISEFDLPSVNLKLLDKTLLELPNKRDTSLTLMYCLWPAISKCLVVLVNDMFEKSVYPEILKSNSHSHVETEYVNYQNSILPTLCDTVKTIIAKNLLSHLAENNFLANKYYSYGPRVAATMTAESIFHLVATDLDDKLKVAGIFCDLSPAFNMVSHKHLLNKLYGLGIRNNALLLVQGFLQRTGNEDPSHINENNNYNLNSGLPQGSVLGDALFLLYVNDISTSIDVGRCILAPDARTAIIIVSEESYSTLKNVIDRVFTQLRSWLEKNELPNVNVEIMNFSARAVKNPPLDDYPLCENYEFFGLTLDANLSFKMHVDNLCDKLSSAVFALRKLRSLVSIDALKQLYYKYFHLPMSYAILVWGNSVDSENILGIQIRALRTLDGVPADYVDTKGLFRKYRILTLYSQYLFELLTFTRVNNFTRKGYRLKFATNNPRIGGPEIFAKLPTALKNEPLESFKSNIKELLLDNPLYSVEEFTKVMKNINETVNT